MKLNKYELYKDEFNKFRYVLIIEEDIKALLRSIPLLQLYNINQFTYPYGWRIGESKDYEILKHNFLHINDIKEKNEEKPLNPFCMVTTSIYDNIAEYSVMSVINYTNRKMVVILKKEDSHNKRLKGFVRPIAEEDLFYSNFLIHYNTLYEDSITYLIGNCKFQTMLPNNMNLFLQYSAFVLNKLFDITMKNTYEFVKYLLDESFNPLHFSIVKILDNIRSDKRLKVIEKIGGNLGYYFDLTNNELKKISEQITSNYYDNKYELEYWIEENTKNKSLIKRILEIKDSVKEPLRSGLLYHWNMIINHFY